MILVAFSGGGSRATALGLSVLDQLAALSYRRGRTTTRLIDRVRVVSSVSGGSVIAGWFGYAGPDGLDQIKEKFLTKDNMATLIWKAADPITWARLTFGRYTRIDALRDLLDQELFAGARFAAFDRPGAPLVLLNATDMDAGEVFAFTPERFDDICSDLAQLPIAAGVAASAAFPVALSPLSLENYTGANGACAGELAPAEWIADDLNKAGPRYLNLEEFKRARYANALRHGPDAFRTIDYVHLLDGGVVDNQGVGSMEEALFSPHGPIKILNAINDGAIKKIVVIAVNARSDPPSNLSASGDTPGLISVVNAVTGVPIDSATAYSNASLKLLVDELNEAGADAKKAHQGDPKFAGLKVYGVAIDFDQFRKGQEALRDKVKAIGTSWTLTPDDLATTLTAGQTLLQQHPCFQRFLLDMKVRASFVDPSFATTYCPIAQ